MSTQDLPDPPSTTLARAEAPPADPALAARLAHLVEKLRAISRRALLAHTLEVGRTLIDALYGGSVHAYYAPDDAGHASFAALCRDHAEALAAIGLPRDGLRLCIRAYDAWRLLPPAVRDELGSTQLVRLLRVHDPATRSELAQRAVGAGWTIRELDAAIAKEVADERPARAPKRATVERARRAVREIGATTRKLAGWHEVLVHQSPRQRAAARAEAVAAVERLQALVAALDATP
jgi:hypothetical protein